MTQSIGTFPPGARLIANPMMVLREEDDSAAILFDPDTGAVRVLNMTAVAIWKLLDGTRTFDQLLVALADEFNGMDADAEQQVMRLLNSLAEIGAVGMVTELRR